MQGKRHRSRGNVAIAALFLVALVGVGALTVDSLRVAQSPQSQLATTISTDQSAADAKKAEEKIKQVCTAGFDYIVRYENKALTVRPTRDGKNATTVANGNQCGPLTTPPKVVNGRQCSNDPKTGWKCKVTVCIPKEVTQGGVQEQCLQIPEYSVSHQLDQQHFRDDMTAQIASQYQGADKATIDRIASKTLEMDPSLSKSIYDSMGGDQQYKNQMEQLGAEKTNLDRAKEDNEAALRALSDCKAKNLESNVSYYIGTTKCRDEYAAADSAKKALEERQRKYDELAKQAQPLDAVKSKLGSQTPPTTSGCPKEPCPTDEKKPPTNKDNCTFGSCGDNGNPGGNPGGNPSNSSGFNPQALNSLMGLAKAALGLFGGTNPSCTLRASPSTISQPGQPVTLSWTTQNAQSAYLSASGQVGPTGQITVNPQQTTTYTMQVVGYPQQQPQYNAYAQQQGQYMWNPFLNAYVYQQAPQQPYEFAGQQAGPPKQGQCQVQVTVGQSTGEDGDAPKAQISCQPKIADVGMAISISYACQRAHASKGEGFSTDNKLSGSAQAQVVSPGPGSTTVAYGVTCSKDGVTDSAQCTINVNKPSIVLVANPKDVEEGGRANIGWVTGAMERCVISSSDVPEFTEANKNNTSTAGSAKTPPLTRDARFVLTCTTKAGGTNTAETTVDVE